MSESRFRVRYAETDQMGVVYHANYLVWFEIGRVDFLRELGLNYKQMEQETHCGIAVVDASVRYKAPARYDDQILVRTRLDLVRGSLIHFAYQVYRAAETPDEKDLLLTEGKTIHVVVDKQMRRAQMPAKYAEAFHRFAGRPER